MWRTIPTKATAASPETGAQAATLGRPAGRLIQCRQCTEFFAKSTLVCPRCNRWNDRSPLSVALRFFAVILVIATVAWSAWFITRAASTVGSGAGGSVNPLPKGASDAPPARVAPDAPRTSRSSDEPDQPEVRF